eukprot:6173267-Amphidinium_carterae.1
MIVARMVVTPNVRHLPQMENTIQSVDLCLCVKGLTCTRSAVCCRTSGHEPSKVSSIAREQRLRQRRALDRWSATSQVGKCS